MNTKRLLLAFLASFVFIFFFEWMLHGVLLKDIYAQSQSLWRPPEEMMSKFHWLIMGQGILALMFTIIYAQGFSGSGVIGGVQLGIFLAILFVGMDLVTFAVQPLPGKLIAAWMIGGVIECALAGAIIGAIYRPVATQPPMSS
jgi:hypothetical protein